MKVLGNSPESSYVQPPRFLVVEKLEYFLYLFERLLATDIWRHEENKILKGEHSCTLLIHIADELIKSAVLS